MHTLYNSQKKKKPRANENRDETFTKHENLNPMSFCCNLIFTLSNNRRVEKKNKQTKKKKKKNMKTLVRIQWKQGVE